MAYTPEFRTYTQDNVQVITLSGRFDGSAISPIRHWLEEATSKEPANIVVNLNQVTFLDSSALATLVFGLKRATQFNGALRLCCLQRRVRLLFELTRMDRVFEIYPCEEDAINTFASIDSVINNRVVS
jgi:anti-sigma B factor antagonist